MAIKIYKPYTPSTRNRSVLDFSLLTKKKSEKSLTVANHRAKGRNNKGRITIRHKGGGHKRLYRLIDFKRNKYDILGIVVSIEYDPNRNANIALINYSDGEKRYILHPENLNIGDSIVAGKNLPIQVGNALPLDSIPLGTDVHNIELFPGKVVSIEYDPNRNTNIALISYEDGEKRYILQPEKLALNAMISSGKNAPIEIGNALPLNNIPLGTDVHNVELIPGKGGQLIRAAGTSAKILAKENNFVVLRLSSKEIRLFKKECFATIGRLSNPDFYNVVLGKAGRSRWLGIRPTVRGSVMNPVDHPHGGGEGRCPIGKPRPLTPWGKPALGIKTRKRKNKSDLFIIRSRS